MIDIKKFLSSPTNFKTGIDLSKFGVIKKESTPPITGTADVPDLGNWGANTANSTPMRVVKVGKETGAMRFPATPTGEAVIKKATETQRADNLAVATEKARKINLATQLAMIGLTPEMAAAPWAATKAIATFEAIHKTISGGVKALQGQNPISGETQTISDLVGIEDPNVKAWANLGQLIVEGGIASKAAGFLEGLMGKPKTIPVESRSVKTEVPVTKEEPKIDFNKFLADRAKVRDTEVAQLQAEAPLVYERIKAQETKTPAVARQVEALAIENKLTDTLGELPQYNVVNMKEQARLASDLVLKSPELAYRVALGIEQSPKGVIPEAVFTAIEDLALRTKNIEVLQKLATQSTLVGEATTMGQRIRTIAERTPENPVAQIQKVATQRSLNAEARLGKKIAVAKQEVLDGIKMEVKIALPKPKDWATFIDSIKC